MRSILLIVTLTLLSAIPVLSQSATLEVAYSTNLLVNGNFLARDPEQRPLHWVTGMGLQSATITNREKHGTASDDLSVMLVDTSATSDLLLRSEKHIAVPETKYIASSWMKGGSGKTATLYLEFWNQNDVRIRMAEVSPTFDSLWTEYTVSVIAPNNVTHVTVALLSSKDNIGTSYWDDISLVYEFNYEKSIKQDTRELFLDDYRIESMEEVQRLVHPPKETRPLIKPTEPWEGNAVYIYGTVLKNEPVSTGYRMWYTAYSNDEYYLCYATSVDGIKWVKPNLGLIDFKGNKKNNICRVGGGTLVYDSDDKDSNRRYKLIAVSKVDNEKKIGYGVWFSPDGLRWKAYEGNPVISYADVSNVAYDKSKKLFIATTKQRMLLSNTSVTPGKVDRAAFVSVSKDFIHWTAPASSGSPWLLAVEGDKMDDWAVISRRGIEGQIYGMPVYPYEGIYIGFPWCFDLMNYATGIYAGYGDGPIQPQIAASRDLQYWKRPSREPVIPLGKAGASDDGTIYTSSSMQISKKQIDIYFGAMNLPHGGDKGSEKQVAQIAKASWRRDGFVSLHNEGNDVGVITTKPFIFQGKKLLINTKLFPTGKLKIEVLDVSKKPVPEFGLSDTRAITGDRLSVAASWQRGVNISSL